VKATLTDSAGYAVATKEVIASNLPQPLSGTIRKAQNNNSCKYTVQLQGGRPPYSAESTSGLTDNQLGCAMGQACIGEYCNGSITFCSGNFVTGRGIRFMDSSQPRKVYESDAFDRCAAADGQTFSVP
jgi:hypothetical protein